MPITVTIDTTSPAFPSSHEAGAYVAAALHALKQARLAIIEFSENRADSTTPLKTPDGVVCGQVDITK